MTIPPESSGVFLLVLLLLGASDNRPPLFVGKPAKLFADIVVIPARELVEQGNQFAVVVASGQDIVHVAQAIQQ